VIVFNRGLKPLSMIDFCVIAISIFILGEELSWGWQLYQFKVFDFFHLYNSSHEPNIHNIEVADGLMIEAFLYAFFTLFIIATLVVKKWRFNKFNFGFRCFLTFQCALIYGGVLYRLMINNSDHVEMLLDMPEELIEYSIAYFVLFTNFNNFNAASFSEFSVRKLNLEEKILERTQSFEL
ncbi:MAG TPA: hypothetical protein VKY45_12980, partial [Marinilabiliaceae bacterium]|nr:hypothetical protein [Marinilabiliaceae bacterium]